jgi:ketosteroid isomerase-like protein
MSEQENLKVVRSLFECFGRGDVPALLGLLDGDVDWHIKGPAEVPYFGPRRGHEGALDFFGKLGTSVEFENFAPQEFLAGGDNVVVVGTERGRVRATGKSFDNDWAMVFTLRDGKITKFRSHEDTAAVAEAFKEQ